MLCDENHIIDPSKAHAGKYIGQTSRTLYERAHEHVSAMKNFDLSSMMLKHWSIVHNELEFPPKFRFRVIRCHADPLTRLIHESIKIMDGVSMNSKAEWRGYKVPRLTVELSEKEAKSNLEKSDEIDRREEKQIIEVVKRCKKLGIFKKNNIVDSRKRKAVDMSDSMKLLDLCDAKSNQVDANAKKLKSECETVKFMGVTSKKGKWGKWSRSTKMGANSSNSVWKWLQKTSTPTRPAKVLNDANCETNVNRVGSTQSTSLDETYIVVKDGCEQESLSGIGEENLSGIVVEKCESVVEVPNAR